MGKRFGNLQRLKGVVYYSLSPFELRPFQGILLGFINGIKVNFTHIVTMIPGAIFTYAFIAKINDLRDKEMRKNPADYENEV